MAIEETFRVNVEATGGAEVATVSDELTRLADQLFADTRELKAMQAALRNMRGDASISGETIQGLKDKVAIHNLVIAQAQARYVELGGTFKRVSRDAAGVKMPGVTVPKVPKVPEVDKLNKLNEAGSVLPGVFGRIASAISPVRALLAVGMVGAVIAVVAVVATLAVAVVALAAKLTSLGIRLADTRRDALLAAEGMIAMNRAIAGQGDAASLANGVRAVADEYALARDKVVGYQAELYKAGLRGAELQSATRAAAIAAKGAGDEHARAFLKTATAAATAGNSVAKLASDIDTKLGRVAAARANGLDSQFLRLRTRLAAVFSGLKIDGFLSAVGRFVDLFREGSAVAESISYVFESLFQPLVDGAGGATSSLRKLVQYGVIGALHLQIAWRRLKLLLITATNGTFLNGVADDLSAVGLLFSPVTLGLKLTYQSLMLAGRAARFFAGELDGALTTLFGANWVHAGANLVDGVVKGVVAGAGKLATAVKGLAKSAFAAFKDAAGIRSPSRVMIAHGVNVSEGAAVGIRRGVPSVRAANASLARVAVRAPRLVTPGGSLARAGRRIVPSAPAPARAPARPQTPAPARAHQPIRALSSSVVDNRRSSSSRAVRIDRVELNVNAADGRDTKGLAEDLWSQFVSKLEGSAATFGASAENEAV